MPACAIYTYPQSSYARLNRQQAQQAVDVDDEIAHLRVVNSALRFEVPSQIAHLQRR